MPGRRSYLNDITVRGNGFFRIIRDHLRRGDQSDGHRPAAAVETDMLVVGGSVDGYPTGGRVRDLREVRFGFGLCIEQRRI